MPAKKNTNTKTQTKSVESVESVVEVAPVEVAPVDTTPVEVAPVDTTPVEVAPVEVASKKKAKKTVSKKQESDVAEPVVAEPVVAKKGTKSKKEAKPVKVQEGDDKTEEVKQTKQAKKTKKTKKVKLEQSTDESKEEVVDEAVVDDDLKSRSFKVKLPDDTDYKGRFTGLTPYQAANKALSKYFRNQENVNLSDNNQILFSIKESTRGTNKKVYNYQGSRIKLETAISYTIKSADGTERIITKQYKNQLIKIKKNPSTTTIEAPALA
jgi:hypothetical protein